jgi:hypothetical protein
MNRSSLREATDSFMSWMESYGLIILACVSSAAAVIALVYSIF